jgi:hypothetical protein
MGLQKELQDIIEALSGEAGVTPPPGTKDQLKWYLDYIIAILREGGGGGVETFVREYNGEVGIGVSVDASGNPPPITGSDGDFYFTLAFNSTAVEEIPEGWIIIAWEWVAGMWEFSSALLPIAAKDLHWVAVKNGADIAGYYIILTGNTETDLPKWELLGAAAVVPDGKTIDYNGAGKLETTLDTVGQNPNLIDNPDFTINQRGLATYDLTTQAWTYALDRWSYWVNTGSSSLTKVTNGIQLTRNSGTGQLSIAQCMESKVSLPSPITLSLSVEGVVYTYTTTEDLSSKAIGFNPKTQTFRIHEPGIKLLNEIVRIEFDDYVAGETTPVINWVKLEAGSRATQFVKPDPATEMYKCQRYLAPISTVLEIVVKDIETVLARPFHLRSINNYGVYNPDGLSFYLKSLDGQTVSAGVLPTSFSYFVLSREGEVRVAIKPMFSSMSGVLNMNITPNTGDNIATNTVQPVLLTAEI